MPRVAAVSRFPFPDKAAGHTLGSALRRLGYSEDGVVRLLGEDAYSAGREDVPVLDRKLPATPLGTVIRAFFLELPVPTAAATEALGRAAVSALATTGLATVGEEEIVPSARITPVGDLVLASDGLSSNPEEDPEDYVSTYSPTSRLCDLLTPRPRVARALDVGTGNGVHALLAALHCRRVIATDVNERALAFTALNAALNDIDNVECRTGSLFEPVAGETFDLITCNAPFVVSPERRWVYRDGTFEGDEVSAHVVRGAAEHLAEGGFATMLVSWVGTDEDEPDEHPLEWVDDLDADVWILGFSDTKPLDHAARWNAHLTDDPQAFGEALDNWTAYLEQLGAVTISEGAVLLHSRPGGDYTVRADSVDEDEIEIADEQIQRAFDARARLEAVDLATARLIPPPELVVEEEDVVLEAGTQPLVEASSAATDVIVDLDGTTTIAELLGSVAEARGVRPEKLEREVVEVVRELLELGALRLG
jgi:methylase of polypeptide subunit release factors